METPICLIEKTEDAKLVVNPEATKILSKFNNPLVVVSIVGMLQTGKSYLMNQLARAARGFNLGFNVQSKTKGIWIWCVPHPIEEDYTLVLLDTEGLGDVEERATRNDIGIFSLSVLLSSMLVYNSMGTIDQDAIDKVKFVGEISNLIKVKSQENDDREAEFKRNFPTFIWAVRDFQLGLIDGKMITEDEYLENALKLQKPEKSIRDQDYNRVRQQLRMYFGKRKCFVFDLPTDNKQHLKRLEDVPDSELNADFVAQSQKFCDYILREANVKKIKEKFAVTGPRLGELAKMYTEALNSSKVACMEEVGVYLSDKENKMAIQEAIQHYEEKMKEVVLPTDTHNRFLDISRQYENQAQDLFLTRCFPDGDQQYFKEFLENINILRNEYSLKNEVNSLKNCGALIKNLSLDFEKALAEGAYFKPGGHGKFKQDLMIIEIKYNKESGKGLKAEEVLQAYIKSKEGDEALIIQKDNAVSQRAQEEEEETSRKKTEEIEEKIRQLQEAYKKQNPDEEVADLRGTARKEYSDEEITLSKEDKLESIEKEDIMASCYSDEEKTKKKMEKMEEDIRTLNKELEQVYMEWKKVQQEYVQFKQATETKLLMMDNTKKEKEKEEKKIRKEIEEMRENFRKQNEEVRALQETVKQLNEKMKEDGK